MTHTWKSRSFRVALASLFALGLAACSPAQAPSPDPDTALTVAAAFYPLEYVAARVGGDRVTVLSLTPPGVSPHHLELSPRVVREVRESDLVLFLSGFQPMVDDAIESTGVNSLDVADIVPLIEGGDDHDEDGHDHDDQVGTDPHFWTDPTLLALYAEAVAGHLAELDPDGADTYRANYAALAEDLVELDTRYTETLGSCERNTLLVSHEAFGYWSARYGLDQIGLSGINPEAEPSPARLREIRALAQEVGATTVYLETLVDPKVVHAFAQDAGLEVATLDPIGGLIDLGDDYLVIMERNLNALRTGLGCE